jgi:hypothetical protein
VFLVGCFGGLIWMGFLGVFSVGFAAGKAIDALKGYAGFKFSNS